MMIREHDEDIQQQRLTWDGKAVRLCRAVHDESKLLDIDPIESNAYNGR